MNCRLAVIAAALCSTSALCAEVDPTAITLREYVDVRFEAQAAAVSAALASTDRAVQKAEAASDKRFEGVNEFRAALSDSARLTMPRAEAEQQYRALAEKLDALAVRMNAREEQERGLSQGWALLIAVLGVAAVVWSMFLKGRALRE